MRLSILPNRKSVIVVDDDPDMLRGLHRLLRQYGFKVALFDSVESFQNRADLDAAFCIVLDVNLGDGSGIELSQQLSERGASLPIILITGNDSDATRNALWAEPDSTPARMFVTMARPVPL